MSTDFDRNAGMPTLTVSQVQSNMIAGLPPIDYHDEVIESVGPNTLRLRLPFKSEYLGAELWQDGSGHVFSGPMVMAVADTAMAACVQARLLLCSPLAMSTSFG